MHKKTNKKMMILSCLGIILMVIGHISNQIGIITDIFPIYSFHMALFIFISGYFYNETNENNVKKYIMKKVKKLVIPYFIWNFIYGLIVTFLRKMDIVSYGQSISFKSFFIEPWITGHQYKLNLGAWFLLALFLVNVCYILIRKLFNKTKLHNDYYFLIFLFTTSLLSIYFSKMGIGKMYIPILRTFFFMFFYHLGYLYKTKIEGKIKINTFLSIIIYFAILIIVNIILANINEDITYQAFCMNFRGRTIISPIISSITGILLLLKISEILEPLIGNNKLINYISNNTFDIMMHHLFWIFIFDIFISRVFDIFMSNVCTLPNFSNKIIKIIVYYKHIESILQTVVGIIMPLCAKYIFEKIYELKIEATKK